MLSATDGEDGGGCVLGCNESAEGQCGHDGCELHPGGLLR